MKIYFPGDIIEYPSPAIALGNFDGMHAGHLHIIQQAKALGKSFGVLLFENHTSNTTGKGVRVITPLYEKLEILSDICVDFVYLENFNTEFMNMSCEEFADYIKSIGAAGVSVGYDYRFGKGASGTSAKLSELLENNGIKTVISDAVSVDNEPIKSSRIRELIAEGDITEANKLMTRPLTRSGIVVSGFQNGRKMGFPTANLEYNDNVLLPRDGVYYGECVIDDMRYRAVINIGKNPTFSAGNRTVEAHIIGYNNDLYGSRISIKFYEKIRDEMRFESIAELRKQIALDINYASERESSDKEINR